MTNREWVQQNTDKAVVEMLTVLSCRFCAYTKNGVDCSCHYCKDGILKWLEAEHEVDNEY